NFAERFELWGRNIVNRNVTQRIETGPPSHVGTLRTCLLPLGKRCGAREQSHCSIWMCMIDGTSRLFEVASHSGVTKSASFHGFDAPEEPGNTVIGAMVVRHCEQVE